jgi:predicted Rossmann fold nucleotide-binding protein DprA/Smf involved in DNA uptake
MSAKVVSIPMSENFRERAVKFGVKAPESLIGVGNAELLKCPLLAVIASRSCPGNVLLQTVELVPEWVRAGKVIASGFHSPLEQQVLRSALRRNGRVVKFLARGMGSARFTQEENDATTAGNMLIVTAFPPEVKRTTRASSLERNRFVLAIADERCVPWIDQDSPLREMTV